MLLELELELLDLEGLDEELELEELISPPEEKLPEGDMLDEGPDGEILDGKCELFEDSPGMATLPSRPPAKPSCEQKANPSLE